MLHHITVPLHPCPGVDHLVNEGDVLDGVDGVQIVFDPDAMLSEVCSDALPPVDVIIARTGLGFLQDSSLTRHPPYISPSPVSHILVRFSSR